MKLIGYIIGVLGVLLIWFVVCGETETMELFAVGVPLLVLFSSVWVFIDATRLGVKAGQLTGFKSMGPAGWLFSCLLLWIIGFPYYLSVRPDLKRALPRYPECGGVVVEGARKCLHCGSAVERILEPCCPACGQRRQIRESRLNEQIECRVCQRVYPASSAVLQAPAP